MAADSSGEPGAGSLSRSSDALPEPDTPSLIFTIACLIDGQPLEALVLFAQPNHRILGDECREGDAHLDGAAFVQIEAAHRHVIESARLEACFLPQLTERGFLRFLSRIDLSVDGLPGIRPLAIGRALQNENAPIAGVMPDHE